jgi:energy-coupling factor transporter ATP-binding protein EcfA2
MSELDERLAGEILAALAEPGRGRIFALMGPNGAGKSNLLRWLQYDLLAENRRVFLLPPVREPIWSGSAFAMQSDEIWPSVVEATLATPPHRGGEQSRSGGRAIWMQTPTPQATPRIDFRTAITAVLQGLAFREAQKEQEFQRSLVAWHAGDRNLDAIPERTPSLVEKVSAHLSAILGYGCQIDTRTGGGNVTVQFHTPRGAFGPQQLSDGEKQIFLLSAFLAESVDQEFVFLADEPELHLNEARAIEIWEQIERLHPRAVFLHATHNVLFATRPSVDTQMLLNTDHTIERIDRSAPVPAAVIRDLMGARVQIMRKPGPTVFCEDSFLRRILTDLLPPDAINIVELSGHEAVAQAVKGEGLWNSARSPGMKWCGVIDRDARDDTEVANLEAKGILCFPLFEAESILLDAEIGSWLLSQFSESAVDTPSYAAMLANAASGVLHQTVQLIGAHLSQSYRATIEFQLSSGASSLTSRSAKLPTAGELESAFDLRTNELFAAIANRDTNAICKLFAGELLYRRMANGPVKLKISDAEQMYEFVRDKPGFVAIFKGREWLQDFRSGVLQKLR